VKEFEKRLMMRIFEWKRSAVTGGRRHLHNMGFIY
jgi:hypothetical protein